MFYAHRASCPVGTSLSFTWVKRAGREVGHFPPSSVDVKSALGCSWETVLMWAMLPTILTQLSS
jgi:hypothetical protein